MEQLFINVGLDGSVGMGDGIPMDVSMCRSYSDPKAPGIAFVTKVNAAGEKEAVPVGYANATTLTRDEWEKIDAEIMRETHDRLAFVNWLVGKGCNIDLNGMSITQYTWQKVSGSLEANLSMDGKARGNGNRPTYTEDSTIIPIISADWDLDLRATTESRNKGIPLDMYQMVEAMRVCTEKVETMMIAGTSSFKALGKTVYGLCDSPAVKAIDETTNSSFFTKDWDTATGAEILADLLEMVRVANNERYWGPFTLWLPQKYQLVMAKDYASGYAKTIGQRLMESGVVSEIKYSDYLFADGSTKDRVFLIQPRKENIAVIRGMNFTNFQETRNLGFSTAHKIAGIYVPLLRTDGSGKTGVIKASLEMA